MAIEKVRDYLRSYGYENKIREFPVSSATVALAAEALGVDDARIAKSLSVRSGDRIILIVCAGDARLHNGKFKAVFGTKPSMLTYDEVKPLIGHAVGGVCPFAINDNVEVYLDESLKRFGTVFPACGSSNSAIELTPEELFKLSGAKSYVDVCKLPEN